MGGDFVGDFCFLGFVEGGSGNDGIDAMAVDSALEAASVGGEGDAEEDTAQIEI